MRSHLQRLLRLLYSLFTIPHVHGRENFPADGPYLFATNHIGFLDPSFVFAHVNHSRVSGWAAEKYRRHVLFGPLLRLGGAIFVRRGEVDRAALRSALQALSQGVVFGLAPEGTRSPTGALIRGRTGVAYLAYRAKAPIVPGAITGTSAAWRAWSHLRRPILTLRIGQPFSLPDLDGSPSPEDLRRGTDEVMCRIAALLPEKLRGVYADHPRTHALLREETVRSE
jgi:1-acyl-sn-glycerol-3-phosphate acyltransferase